MSSDSKHPDLSVAEASRTSEDIHGEEYNPVPARYRGTAVDKQDMAVLGRIQLLRRNFSFITMVGFASTVMASWEAILPLFTFVLTDGGTALFFWGFIVIAFGQTMVYASVAEMASLAPTAGGQYHWVAELAPPRFQKPLSYLTGWLTAIGWQFYLAAAAFMAGSAIQGLIALNVEGYAWQQYHGTLLTISVSCVSAFVNTLLTAHLPMLEGCFLLLHVLGCFAIVVPLWIMGPRGSVDDVLLTFANNGGWPSTGLSAMIGLSAPIGVYIGYDCSVHMSEEIKDASLALPRAIMWACLINFFMVFLVGCTLIFTMGDTTSILTTPTGWPFIQVIYNATESYGGTSTMVGVVIVLFVSCTVSELATASRQLWSFSRDGGVPGSSWLSVVNPKRNIPLRAVALSTTITALISCINLGSSIALNAITSLGGVSILTSYFISISCMIWRRYQGPLPEHRWSLGRYGFTINVIALIFVIPVWFFAWWPLATPVTATNMNWSSVIFGTVICAASIYYYFKARHGQYVSPVVHIKRQ